MLIKAGKESHNRSFSPLIWFRSAVPESCSLPASPARVSELNFYSAFSQDAIMLQSFADPVPAGASCHIVRTAFHRIGSLAHGDAGSGIR